MSGRTYSDDWRRIAKELREKDDEKKNQERKDEEKKLEGILLFQLN